MELSAKPANHSFTLCTGKIPCQLPYPVWSPHFKEKSNNRLKTAPETTWVKHCENPFKKLDRVALEQPDRAGCDRAVTEGFLEGANNGSGDAQRSCPGFRTADTRAQPDLCEHLSHSCPLRCNLQHHNVFSCLFDWFLFCLFSRIPYCLFLSSLLDLLPDIKLVFTENGLNKCEEIFH